MIKEKTLRRNPGSVLINTKSWTHTYRVRPHGENPGNHLTHSQRRKNFDRLPRELQCLDGAQTSTNVSGRASRVGVLSALPKNARSKRYVRMKTKNSQLYIHREQNIAGRLNSTKYWSILDRKFEEQLNKLELGLDVFCRKYRRGSILTMSEQKLIHQNKKQQAVFTKINVRASRSRAFYRRRYVPSWVNIKITAKQHGLPSSQFHLQCTKYMAAFGLEG